jgi:hypothetical protein
MPEIGVPHFHFNVGCSIGRESANINKERLSREEKRLATRTMQHAHTQFDHSQQAWMTKQSTHTTHTDLTNNKYYSKADLRKHTSSKGMRKW